jgi:hypothetical protein
MGYGLSVSSPAGGGSGSSTGTDIGGTTGGAGSGSAGTGSTGNGGTAGALRAAAHPAAADLPRATRPGENRQLRHQSRPVVAGGRLPPVSFSVSSSGYSGSFVYERAKSADCPKD